MEINECLQHPCLNGGTCIDTEDGFKCDCKNGYTGNICNLLQEGQVLRLGTGALAAILICLLIILGESPFVYVPFVPSVVHEDSESP